MHIYLYSISSEFLIFHPCQKGYPSKFHSINIITRINRHIGTYPQFIRKIYIYPGPLNCTKVYRGCRRIQLWRRTTLKKFKKIWFKVQGKDKYHLFWNIVVEWGKHIAKNKAFHIDQTQTWFRYMNSGLLNSISTR